MKGWWLSLQLHFFVFFTFLRIRIFGHVGPQETMGGNNEVRLQAFLRSLRQLLMHSFGGHGVITSWRNTAAAQRGVDEGGRHKIGKMNNFFYIFFLQMYPMAGKSLTHYAYIKHKNVSVPRQFLLKILT